MNSAQDQQPNSPDSIEFSFGFPFNNLQSLVDFGAKLIKDTIFTEDESDTIENKGYYWPLNEDLKRILQKTFCAFLNRYGGDINMGIDKNSYVRGIKLSRYERDELKRMISYLARDFEPAITSEEPIKTLFYNVLDPVKKTKIPGLFVVKIIVPRGDLRRLYSISKIKFIAYKRTDSENKWLNVKQITEEIAKRCSDKATKIIPQREEYLNADQRLIPIVDDDQEQVRLPQSPNQPIKRGGPSFPKIRSKTPTIEKKTFQKDSPKPLQKPRGPVAANAQSSPSQESCYSTDNSPTPPKKIALPPSQPKNQRPDSEGVDDPLYTLELDELPPVLEAQFMEIFYKISPAPVHHKLIPSDDKNKFGHASVNYQRRIDAWQIMDRINNGKIKVENCKIVASLRKT